MQPERVLLQKPMDAAQATLANGVRCGTIMGSSASSRGRMYGWGDALRFTGDLFPWPDIPVDLKVPASELAVLAGIAGSTILAINTSKQQGRVSVLLDRGEDEDNPGARECSVFMHLVDNLVSEELKDGLIGWNLL